MKLRSIQVLRGVAACSVVVLHSYAWAYDEEISPARIGAAGVDLFFVISGFIIATIPKRPSFLFDRVWRVYPVWLVAAVPWLFVVNPSWQMVLSTVTHWPIYDRFTEPVIPIGWTLSFEVLFYAAMALGIALRPAIPLVLFGLFLGGAVLTDAPIFDYLGNPMIFEFLFGVAIAKLPRDGRFGLPLIAGAVVLLALSPLTIYGSKFAIVADLSWARALFWGFPCSLLVYGSLCLERYFRDGLPMLLGDASFSIYLWHIPTIQYLRFHWLTEIGLAIFVGIVMWWLVERPIQGARDRVRLLLIRVLGWKAPRSPAPAPTAPPVYRQSGP